MSSHKKKRSNLCTATSLLCIGGSDGKGILGGGEDQGDNGDAGGEDIAKSLATSESLHAGIGTGAGIEILAVVR
nr:hypothetical protein [Tanacetum cinerariifolium]